MKTRIILTATLVVMLVMFSGCPKPAPAPAPAPVPAPTTVSPPKVIVWDKFQNLVAPGPPKQPFGDITGSGALCVKWARWVEKATNGRLVIKYHAPGALVSATEALKATGTGMVDGLLSGYGGYWTGTIPEADIQVGLPTAWADHSEAYYAYYRMGLLEEFRKIYAKHNIFLVAPVILNEPYYHIGTTFPVYSIDDVKGKKIRALGVYGDYIKELGGSPVVLPPQELYMALKLGTIDGTLHGLSGLEDVKLKEVLKYYVVSPSLNVIVSSIMVNMDKWNALPEDIKTIILRDTEYVLAAAGCDYRMEEELVLAHVQKEYGVKAVYWSEKDIAKVRDICINTLWPKIGAKSPDNARLVGMVTEQAKKFGKIK